MSSIASPRFVLDFLSFLSTSAQLVFESYQRSHASALSAEDTAVAIKAKALSAFRLHHAKAADKIAAQRMLVGYWLLTACLEVRSQTVLLATAHL